MEAAAAAYGAKPGDARRQARDGISRRNVCDTAPRFFGEGDRSIVAENKTSPEEGLVAYQVVHHEGLEPSTLGLRVPCSTN